jgi:hypothetical protein
VGVLVTAAFHVSNQELRTGVASKHSAMAVNLAQVGANEIMANWSGYQLGRIPVQGDTTITDTAEAGVWSVNVKNLNNRLYFLEAESEVTEGGDLWAGASRRVGIITRILFADIDPPAALTTRGTTSIRGTAEVHGEDMDPGSWGSVCSGIHEDKPGILTNDTTKLGTTGSGEVTGSPKWDQDSTIVDSTFTTFGELTWDELVRIARLQGKDVTSLGTNINNTGPATDVHGRCDQGAQTNWGDTVPSAPCGNYFPLIYHGGPSLRIQSGGIGQGILLVDGDLDLRGNFAFYGIIIVQGNFETQGSGNRVIGGVMASNADFDDQRLTGGSVVTNSTCAVERAILNNAALSRARPLAQRSWVDLTAVGN